MSKNQNNVHFFNPNRLNLQEEPDGASFISLLLCSAGMFMRNKFIIWLSIFLILSTMCRKKYSSPSTQYLVNGVMIIFALVSNYVIHPPQQWLIYHVYLPIMIRKRKHNHFFFMIKLISSIEGKTLMGVFPSFFFYINIFFAFKMKSIRFSAVLAIILKLSAISLSSCPFN